MDFLRLEITPKTWLGLNSTGRCRLIRYVRQSTMMMVHRAAHNRVKLKYVQKVISGGQLVQKVPYDCLLKDLYLMIFNLVDQKTKNK